MTLVVRQLTIFVADFMYKKLLNMCQNYFDNINSCSVNTLRWFFLPSSFKNESFVRFVSFITIINP